MTTTMDASEMTCRMLQLEVDSSVTKAEILDVLRRMQEQKDLVMDAIGKEFAQIKVNMDSIVMEAAREFENTRLQQEAGYKDLFERTKNAVENLESKMAKMEAGEGLRENRGERGEWKNTGKGYLPLKQTIPDQLGNEPERWRSWKRDTLGYLDSITKGMKVFLGEVESADDDVTETWLQEKALMYGSWKVSEKEARWRALSGLTKDETKKLLEAVPEDG